MNITDRLKLEILIREQLKEHGNEFYNELALILNKLEYERLPKNENVIDLRGKPNMRVRWN